MDSIGSSPATWCSSFGAQLGICLYLYRCTHKVASWQAVLWTKKSEKFLDNVLFPKFQCGHRRAKWSDRGTSWGCSGAITPLLCALEWPFGHTKCHHSGRQSADLGTARSIELLLPVASFHRSFDSRHTTEQRATPT